MKVRGSRECQDCGTEWSYYETGEVNCPDCGSLRSTGSGERTRHTAGSVSLDLTEARNLVDADGLQQAAGTAAEACRDFVRLTGFIDAGELTSLTDTYLAARELTAVADEYRHAMRLDDGEQRYLLSLLRGADFGERPRPEDVPASGYPPRNLAYAAAVDDYRSDCRTYLEENPDPDATRLLARIADHCRRVNALDGELEPAATETLVSAVREVTDYLRKGDEAAFVRADARLDDLV